MKNINSAPLTKTQLGIYIECLNNPESTLYNLPFIAKLGEGIDTDRLETALIKLLEAHPCLNTVLCNSETGEVIQKIGEKRSEV